MKHHTLGPMQFFTYDVFSEHGDVTCVTTTRVGGLSRKPYESFNLGLRCGDDPNAVIDNRAQLSLLTGALPDLLTFGGQVHDRRVAVVTGELIGGGSCDLESVIPDTDAMVTDIPDVPLVVLIADCAAVSFFDPVKKAIGLAHAGWRGTAAGVVVATVEKMRDSFGSDPGDLLAGISPSIGPCCYEVGHEVVDRFRDAMPDTHLSVVREVDLAGDGVKSHLDLWNANRLQLIGAGVREDRIEVAEMCSSCTTELFYSHRAESGMTGRFATLMMLHKSTHRRY